MYIRDIEKKYQFDSAPFEVWLEGSRFAIMGVVKKSVRDSDVAEIVAEYSRHLNRSPDSAIEYEIKASMPKSASKETSYE